ncbi:MAG: molybdenum cofactor biosynthesis protein MoaE [Phycisphaerae bacterium]|nr:molybdenum cofactor biosynthesis protein MoaE [Phycisphaerae bacterium]
MTISVRIVRGPLVPRRAGGERDAPSGTGARVSFEGLVRAREGDRAIVALAYEAYRPMAETTLRELATEMLATHGLIAIDVEHSEGHVSVGACSFRLVIDAVHRKEALAASDEFIDRMKRDVPIWKTQIWAES